jgi:predicted nucleic acid-binding protein
MAFWDTSALLKLYLAEADSTLFESLALGSDDLVTSFIGKHEARTAFRRREAEEVLLPGGAELCYQRLLQDIHAGRVRVIQESKELEHQLGEILDQCLSQTPPVFVRTNDALHLAAAKIAGETEFVTADGRQAAAAKLIGMNVIP